MATFASSSSSFRSLIFVALLLINTWGSCIAMRPGRSVSIVKENGHSSMGLNYFQELRSEEKLHFAKLVKGVPIPPSGPSKRHNSLPQD
ncbi:putative membrane lipoprotein [Salvia divinorum]|uniref:Membrane lipoprotein n=1 Tax=Salvia divinorum TaxID=28513 RepID=A0ABD1H477_SALDI